MAQNIFQQDTLQKVVIQSGNNSFQNYSLRHSHPRALFIDSVGMIWSIYYLWQNDWALALGCVLLGRLMAYLAVMDINPENMSQTAIGKIALLHLNPLNMLTQIAGLILLTYGLWEHSAIFTLCGVSVVLLGHLAGWSRVEPRF